MAWEEDVYAAEAAWGKMEKRYAAETFRIREEARANASRKFPAASQRFRL